MKALVRRKLWIGVPSVKTSHPGGSGAAITGGLTATADVVAGGKSLMSHTHPGDSGGVTGAPN